jgi:hypothetical protein
MFKISALSSLSLVNKNKELLNQRRICLSITITLKVFKQNAAVHATSVDVTTCNTAGQMQYKTGSTNQLHLFYWQVCVSVCAYMCVRACVHTV